MTLTPKWRRLSFGCGLLSLELLKLRFGRRRLRGGRGDPRPPSISSRPSLRADLRGNESSAGDSRPPLAAGNRARRCLLWCDYRPQRKRQSPGDRLPRHRRSPRTRPHGNHAASLHLSGATRFGSHDTSPRRWHRSRESPKADSFFETRRPAPGREKCSATRISTRLRGQHRGRLRQHTQPSTPTAQ